jgi:hypothetical protein
MMINPWFPCNPPIINRNFYFPLVTDRYLPNIGLP